MAEYAGVVMENIARNGVRSREMIAQFFRGIEQPGIRDHEFYGETVDFAVSTDTSRAFEAAIGKLHRRGTRSRELVARLLRGVEHPGLRDNVSYGETVDFIASDDTSRSGFGHIVFMRPVSGKIATHPAISWQSIYCGKRENIFKGESIVSSTTQQELLESYIPRQWPLESAWTRARKAGL